MGFERKVVKMTLLKYAKTRYMMWLTVSAAALLVHGQMLMSPVIGIDTEMLITLQDSFYDGWLDIGRFGLVLLKYAMGAAVFNPYMAGLLTLLFLAGACLLWTYLFSLVSGKESGTAAFVFSILFIVSPIITEQVYYKLQSAEIAAGFCLTAVSLIWTYLAAQRKNTERGYAVKYALPVGASLINVIVFGLYQVMVPLFLFGMSACIFLCCFFNEGRGQALRRLAAYYICVFAAGFLANRAITAIWFSGGDSYLANQVMWFNQPFKDCIINIFSHAARALIGRGLYYSKLYLICLVLLFAAVLASFWKEKKSGKLSGIFSLLLAAAAPFYMTVLCAGEPVLRSQLVMPFALAFMPYSLLLFLKGKRKETYVLLIICAVSGFAALNATMRLEYTESVRYERDASLARGIMEELDRLEDGAHSYPVVFIGKHTAELNNSCVRGEMMGHSFFEADADVEPYAFYSTRRILSFMHTLGGNYFQADDKQRIMALEYAKNMPSYPKEGSVELKDGCIIVKLGD